MIKYRKRSTPFPSHVTTPPKCKPMIRNPWLFPTNRARTSKKPRMPRVLIVTRSSASTMIIPLSLREKWVRSVRPAQWELLQRLRFTKPQRRLWSHLITNKKNPRSWLTKSRKRRKMSNRRPNLVITKIPPAKMFTCWTISTRLSLNATCQMSSHGKKLPEPLSRNSRIPKRLRNQQNLMSNVPLEKSPSGPAPKRCRTSTNSPEFTSSTMPERRQRHSATKQINSTKSAAQPWPKKRRQWLAFSKQSAPMTTWHPTKNDQSHTSSL